jgi:ankyrin repeat protein
MQRAFIVSFSIAVLLAVAGCERVTKSGGWTTLHDAAESGDMKQAVILLDQHPSLVNATDVGDHTPLHLAALYDHPSVASVLIDRGANIGARDSCGWTPLHMAAYGNKPAVAERLIGWGADVNARDHRNQTPLSLAIKYNKNDVAAVLRQHGAVD